MPDKGPKKVASFFSPASLEKLGMPADLRGLPEVVVAWAEIVGNPLARHVAPVRYADGLLHLRADSAVWASKLRHQQQNIITRLQQHVVLKELTDLHIRIAPLQEITTTRKDARRAQRLSHATLALLETFATDLNDPGLRAALQRLGRNH